MRGISRWGRTIGVAACACAAIATAACGSDDATSSHSPATVTVTQSTQTPAPTSDADTPRATDAATEQSTTGGGAPVMRVPADANVNAKDFYGPGAGINAYFFQSPSGNVRCGIDFDDPQVPSGCQAITSVPSTSGLTCLNRGNSVYSTQLISGAAVSKCVNQPFFVGGSGNPGQGTSGGRGPAVRADHLRGWGDV